MWYCNCALKNELVKCYPNPFSDEVTVEINLTEDSQVDVVVLNQLGQQVKYLANKKHLSSGIHQFIWDGKNAAGGRVAPAIYFMRSIINGTIVNHKLILNYDSNNKE